MNVSGLIWIATVTAGTAAGTALALALATPSGLSRLLSGLSVIALGGSGYCVGLLAQSPAGFPAAASGAALSALGLGAGWLTAAAVLIPRKRPHRSLAGAIDLLDHSRACVLVFACIEPEAYSLTATRERIGRLLDAGHQQASLVTLPLLYLAHRSRYDVAGGTNPAARQLRACAAVVSDTLSLTEPARAADCAGAHSLALQVSAAIRSGCTTCIVASPCILHTCGEQDHLARAAGIASEQARSVRTVDLSASTDLVRDVLVSRVTDVAPDPAGTGVVLLSMASVQPDHTPTASTDDVEAALLGSLSVSLVEAGFDAQSMRIAWARDAETQALEHVRHLALQGLSRIVVVQAVTPFDTLDSVIEMDLARRAMRDRCEVVAVGGWGADERICAELARLVSRELGACPAGSG